MAKNQIERLLEIDRRIRAGRFPGRKEIAEHFEVTIKTIERDIDYMRDRLNAPLKYDHIRKGYCYTHEGFFIPTYYITEGDALYKLPYQLALAYLLTAPFTPWDDPGDQVVVQAHQQDQLRKSMLPEEKAALRRTICPY